MSTTAVVIALGTGALGLISAVVTAVVSSRAPREQAAVDRGELGLATLNAAIVAQGAQLSRQDELLADQGERIRTLEDEVRTCHEERDQDRRRYQAALDRDREIYREELDQLRNQIGDRP